MHTVHVRVLANAGNAHKLVEGTRVSRMITGADITIKGYVFQFLSGRYVNPETGIRIYETTNQIRPFGALRVMSDNRAEWLSKGGRTRTYRTFTAAAHAALEYWGFHGTTAAVAT